MDMETEAALAVFATRNEGEPFPRAGAVSLPVAMLQGRSRKGMDAHHGALARSRIGEGVRGCAGYFEAKPRQSASAFAGPTPC